MSSAAPGKKPQLGDRKPAELNPAGRGEFWMKCDLALSPDCEGERWVQMRGAMSQRKMAAVGWLKPCELCSYRERGDRKTLEDEVTMICGSTAYLKDRRNGRKEIKVKCGICEILYYKRMDPKDAFGTSGIRRLGLCNKCKPWALLALGQRIYEGPSPEREEVYAKIKRLLESWDSRYTPTGPKMPFWALLKHYNTTVNATRSHFDRLLALYFDEQPLSAIDPAAVLAFSDFLRNNVSRNGAARATHTVDLILLRLRHIFEHARWERWIKVNPVPKRAEIIPEVLKRKKHPGPEKGTNAFITWDSVKQAVLQTQGYPTQEQVAELLGASVSGIQQWQRREKVKWREVQQRCINPH
jgi:hypothetical protein